MSILNFSLIFSILNQIKTNFAEKAEFVYDELTNSYSIAISNVECYWSTKFQEFIASQATNLQPLELTFICLSEKMI